MRRWRRRIFRGELVEKRVAEVLDEFAVSSALLRRRKEISSCTTKIVADKD